MLITLTGQDVATVDDHGSIVVITGTAEDGSRVTFGGDPRPMADIVLALLGDEEDEVTVDVEGWQITRQIAAQQRGQD